MSEENEQNEEKRIKIDDLPVSETELTDEDEQNVRGGKQQPSPGDELRRGQPSPGGDFRQPSPGGD